MLAHLRVHAGVARLPGAEAIDVAVVHRERGRDQHRVMDFEIGGAQVAGEIDIVFGYQLAVLLDLSGNDQESPEFGADGSRIKVTLDLFDNRRIAKVSSCGSAMAGLAEIRLVARGDKAGDELALAGTERAGLVEQDVRQFAHGFGRLWAVRETGADAGQAFGKINVGHGDSL